jgi:hypothetical protein
MAQLVWAVPVIDPGVSVAGAHTWDALSESPNVTVPVGAVAPNEEGVITTLKATCWLTLDVVADGVTTKFEFRAFTVCGVVWLLALKFESPLN